MVLGGVAREGLDPAAVQDAAARRPPVVPLWPLSLAGP